MDRKMVNVLATLKLFLLNEPLIHIEYACILLLTYMHIYLVRFNVIVYAWGFIHTLYVSVRTSNALSRKCRLI